MTFNSLQYAVFFLVVWSVVAALQPRSARRGASTEVIDDGDRRVAIRNAFLLIASYVFYAAWDVRFLGLLMLSTVVDFACGRMMARAGETAARRRRAIIVVSVTVNLTILGFFKYFNFFAQNAVGLLGALGVHAQLATLEVVLPVGVSFYTFQSLSYTIDVYRGIIGAERSLLRFATFIAFFPQLVAGPIERAATLLPRIARPAPITRPQVEEGALLIAAGLYKKVVIADNVAKVVNAGFALEAPSGVQAWASAYAFAVQIYCDFSGYTDIARGSAKLLGFDLMLNFNLPYFSGNPSEFWRRWHISLSTWLRDYLYISLGGNRGSTWMVYRNLMLTMLLGGLWHGAQWTFIAWGAFHGALLCAHRALEPLLGRLRPQHGAARALYRALTIACFFHLVCVGWIFFRAPSFHAATTMIAALPHVRVHDALEQLQALGPIGFAALLSAALFAVQLVEYLAGDLTVVRRSPMPVRVGVYAAAAILFLLAGDYGGESFIYFQF